MTHNTDPSSTPCNLLTEKQKEVIANNTARKFYQDKNRELGVEIWTEVTTTGKNFITAIKSFFGQL